MTDLLDAPAAREQDAAPPAPTGEPQPDAVALPGWPDGARWLLAACLAGAAVIHVAMAPSHLGESAVEGWGFVAAAWAQLLLAVAVLLRPSRRVALGVVAVSGLLIAAWAVSRIAGLPFGAHAGHPESVSFVDGACVALEAVALVVAAVLAWRPRRSGTALRPSLAIAGAVGALVLTTAAVVSPSARDHAAASHGDHAIGGHGEHGDAADGMAPAADGHDHGGTDPATSEDDGFAALSNGHQHERGQDEPLTAEERSALATQLAATADLVARFPTIADAEAAGWTRAGPFSPGLGVHYRSPEFVLNPDGLMDPEDLAAPMLVFDGVEPEAPLAGFMYMAYGTAGEPEGFAGPNDHWHYHESVCIVYGADGTISTPFGADLEGVTEDMCTEVGGSFIAMTGYMVHVWNVPGYESPDGMFTELNRKITCPDGSYDRIDIADVGSKNTVCLNP
jgi:hypothetical protein